MLREQGGIGHNKCGSGAVVDRILENIAGGWLEWTSHCGTNAGRDQYISLELITGKWAAARVMSNLDGYVFWEGSDMRILTGLSVLESDYGMWSSGRIPALMPWVFLVHL